MADSESEESTPDSESNEGEGTTTDSVHVPSATSGKRLRRAPRKGGLRMKLQLQGGHSIEVRHNADKGEERLCRDVVVELGDGAAGDTAEPVWNQIAKIGHFEGHGAGPFDLTSEIFDDIVRNYRDVDLGQVAFDFEHASEEEPSLGSIPTHGAPAQGWIKALENRGQAGLWGLVEWLEPARTYVKTRKYKSLSPAIRFNARHPQTNARIGARLTSVALTNRPFLRGMSIAARDDITNPESVDLEDLIEAVATRCLSNRDKRDERQSNVALTNTNVPATVVAKETIMEKAEFDLKLKDAETKAIEASLKLKDAETKLASAEAKSTALELELKAAKAENATLATDMKLLKDEQEKRVVAEREAEVDAVIEAYGTTKGIAKEDRVALVDFHKSSLPSFRKLYPPILSQQRHLAADLAHNAQEPEATRFTDTGATRPPPSNVGADIEGETYEEKFTEMVRTLQDKGVDYDTACLRAGNKLRPLALKQTA